MGERFEILVLFQVRHRGRVLGGEMVSLHIADSKTETTPFSSRLALDG